MTNVNHEHFEHAVNVFREIGIELDRRDLFCATWLPSSARMLSAKNASLSMGWRGHPKIFSGRLVWMPRGIPVGRSIALVSSRLGNDLAPYQSVFDAIRTRVAKLTNDETLVCGTSMSLARYIRRAAYWFDRPIICIDAMPDRVDASWIEESLTRASPSDETLVYVSEYSRETQHNPNRALDHQVIELVDELDVLHLAPGGNVHMAVSNRLKVPERTTCVLDTVSPELLNQLTDLGAVRWHLLTADHPLTPAVGGKKVNCDVGKPNVPRPQPASVRLFENATLPTSVCASSQLDFSSYLIHYTRHQKRGWIDDSVHQAVDRVLFCGGWQHDTNKPTPYSALATLIKIVVQRRILASSQAIRGKFPCVCWTAVPLNKLIGHRVFRRHRSRWDAESYGIGIRRSVLEKLKAKPVLYGDDEMWEELDLDQRPFFQKRFSKNMQIDWSVEQEWRHQGDVDLRLIGIEDAFLFVPASHEAAMVEPFSLWPVITVEGLLAAAPPNNEK